MTGTSRGASREHASAGRTARPSIASAVFLLANAALGAGASAFVLVRILHRLTPQSPDTAMFSPEMFGLERADTVAQLWFHRAAFGVVALFCLAAVAVGWARMKRWLVGPLFGRTARALAAAAYAGAAALILWKCRLRLPYLAWAGALPCAGTLVAPSLGRFRRAACAGGAALLIAVYLGIGLATPHTNLLAERPGMLGVVENHYSLVCGTAGRMAAGLRPYEDFRVWYTTAIPVAVAAFERARGHLDLGGYMRLVQWLQAIFCLLACVAWRLWRPREPHTLLYGLALTLPWINTAGRPGLIYPNHSSWRNMIFVVAPLAMIALRRARPGRRAFLAGAVAAAGILFNTETGMVATLAMGVYLFLADSAEPPGRRARYAGYAALGAAACFAAFDLSGRAILGVWPLPAAALRTLAGEGFGRGYLGGRPFTASLELLLGVGIFLHAAMTVIGCALASRARALSANGPPAGGIATLILLWSAYFFNRPEEYYLGAVLFCYTFLLYQLRAAIVTPRPGRAMLRYAAAVFAAFVLVPYAVISNAAALREVRTRLEGTRDRTAREWSGVRLPAQEAGALADKTEYLRQAPPDTLYLTANALSMPQLSGKYPRLPFQDPFGETLLRADYGELLAKIRRSGAPLLLVDPPGSPFYSWPAHRALFARMRADLGLDYRLVGTAHGWEIWQPR